MPGLEVVPVDNPQEESQPEVVFQGPAGDIVRHRVDPAAGKGGVDPDSERQADTGSDDAEEVIQVVVEDPLGGDGVGERRLSPPSRRPPAVPNGGLFQKNGFFSRLFGLDKEENKKTA